MTMKEYEAADLARAEFKVHQLESHEKDNVALAFAGFVDRVIGRINDGKEATVYLCRGDESQSIDYFAAKLYRARVFRSFDTDRRYRNLSKHKDRRMAKAIKGRSSKGNAAFHYEWIESEWRVLQTLYAAGVRVPQPYHCFPDGILMEYFGDAQGAAPLLVHSKPGAVQLARLFEQLLDDIRTMLECDLVHGDLSAFNILFNGEDFRIIDLPQAIDVRTMPDAQQLFYRDIRNLCQYFTRMGMDVDPDKIARDMW